MNHRYLEVTYRDGQAIAAYLYLRRRPGDASFRTERRQAGLLVDYAPDGRPIGIEITSPRLASAAALDQVLRGLNEAPLSPGELAPLAA